MFWSALVMTFFATLRAASFAASLKLGATAPDFRVLTLDGAEISLAEAEMSHRAVVVMFLSTICPYSNNYNDLIRNMASEYEKKGVFFLGINSGRLETAQEAQTHAREHGHRFPIAKDAEGRIARIFDARRTPEVFLLDHEGRLRYHGRISSKLSSPDLRNALEALLAGRPVKPAVTKAFSCAI